MTITNPMTNRSGTTMTRTASLSIAALWGLPTGVVAALLTMGALPPKPAAPLELTPEQAYLQGIEDGMELGKDLCARALARQRQMLMTEQPGLRRMPMPNDA
jgi:hypothetical protein